MPVRLDGKRFEASLIEMSGAACLVVGMPTHRVHDRQPTEKLTHLIRGFGPHDKMPVIRHRHHRINRQGNDLPCLIEHSREGGIIFRLLEDRQSCHRSIENVEDFSRRTNALGTRHRQSLTDTPEEINET